MKKLFIAVAIVAAIGLSTTYANAENATETPVSETVEDQFKAIEADQLPQAVKDAIAKDYEGLTIEAAYEKEAEGVKIYKVTLANAEAETLDVLFNENGEALPTE